MTAHLLLVALGPVQDFIAQARRTRDLWYGSHVLSELSRAAARALVDGGAHLIFPALAKGAAELRWCNGPLRRNGRRDETRPPLNVANKLLAEVPEGLDPRALARATRQAVQAFWRVELSAAVKTACDGLLAAGIDAAWDEQLATLLELSATWAPVTPATYQEARRELEHAISARKSLRDFESWVNLRGNVPKSSLDGGRETVLRPPHEREKRLVCRYVIPADEQLDAVGLVKRAGGDPTQFVPVINVALATWLAHAEREAPREIDALRDACDDIGLARVVRPDLPCASVFPFDASVLLPDRWTSVFTERSLDGDPVTWGRRNVGPLLERVGEPYPYVVCLRADGDRMGHAIASLASADAHRAFSRSLAGFAEETRRIVEQRHRGSLVYAGGDDVLAFLPIPEALACADELRRSFADTVARMAPGTAPPTLSVGLGVGHVLESMGELVDLGREAEHLAKHGHDRGADRNALAIIVDKRSGNRRSWRARWELLIGDLDPVARLRADIALVDAKQLPTRKVHEVAQLLRRLPEPSASGTAPPSPADAAWARVLALEVQRSLLRVDGAGGVEPAAVGLVLEPSADYAALHAEVSAWIDRLLIARTFAAARPRAQGATP